MERLSRAAKDHGEPITKTALAAKVAGNKQAKFLGVDQLVKEGFLAETGEGHKSCFST